MALPLETVAHVAHFIMSWKERRQLLALRAASPLHRDAVERALQQLRLPSYARDLPGLDFIDVAEDAPKPGVADPRYDPRAIGARGRVFGRACRRLSFSVSSMEGLGLIRSLVLNTKGNLTQIEVVLYTSISVEDLLEIFRACPRLETLFIERRLPQVNSTMDTLDYFATRLSLACPLLQSFQFGYDAAVSSPAESLARYFPNFKVLSFMCLAASTSPALGNPLYCPSDLDNIEEAGRRCLRATTWQFDYCQVLPPLITRLLRTPLCSRVHEVNLECAQVSSSSVLSLAVGCPLLRILYMSTDVPELKTPTFFEALSSARPELKELSLDLWRNPAAVNDACMPFIARLGLETLRLTCSYSRAAPLSEAGLNALIAGTCASTLSSFWTFHKSLGTLQFWLFVRACPNLKSIRVVGVPKEWQFVPSFLKQANAILKSRGGSIEWPLAGGPEQV